MSARFRAASLLLAGLLLAGCAGEAPKPATTNAVTEPPTMGAMVEGWVFDDAANPMPGANLSIAALNLSTASDAQGYYRFLELPVDSPIVVVAQAAGFLPSSKSATAVAESAVRLNFTLAPIPTKQARLEVLDFAGFLACEGVVTLAEENHRVDCSSVDPQNKPQWEFTVGPDTAGVVIEVEWTKATDLAEDLNLTIETVGFGDLDQVLTAIEGPSVLRAQVNAAQAERYYSQGGVIRVRLASGTNADEEEASTGAAAAFQQSFQVWASVFYVEPPSPTYTAL